MITDKNINKWLIGSMIIGGVFWLGLIHWGETAKAFVGTQTNLTGSRSFATSYQNTTGNDLIVAVTANRVGFGGVVDIRGLIGVSSPTTIAGYNVTPSISGNAEYATITFVVPDTWYYQIDSVICGTTDCVLTQWWEYETPTISSGGGTSTPITINNDAEELYYGIVLYLIGFWGVIWFFRKQK